MKKKKTQVKSQLDEMVISELPVLHENSLLTGIYPLEKLDNINYIKFWDEINVELGARYFHFSGWPDTNSISRETEPQARSMNMKVML